MGLEVLPLPKTRQGSFGYGGVAVAKFGSIKDRRWAIAGSAECETTKKSKAVPVVEVRAEEETDRPLTLAAHPLL